MKKTLMLIAETCQDGVGRHVSDLVIGLDKDKYRIIVVHGTERVDYYFDAMKARMSGTVVFEATADMSRNIHPIRDIKTLLHVNDLIRHYRPTLIHCHSSKAGVVGRVLGMGKSYVKKVIYTPHAYAIQNLELNALKYGLYMIIERWLGHRKKTMTINVSKGEQAFAIEHRLIGKESAVVYNALEDIEPIEDIKSDRTRRELGIGKGTKLVICVARLYHQKNPKLFVQIAEAVVSQYEHVRFVWVGEGEMLESMRKLVKASGYSPDKISFIGHRQDIHSLLCAADLFLSTSLYEGLPYTLIEASRAGLPIVASDITGNSEVVTEGYNGLLFDLTSGTEGAVEALRHLLDDRETRDQMAENARSVYEHNYQIEAMIHSVEGIYERDCI